MSRLDEPATAAEAEQHRKKTKKRKRLLLEPDADKSVNDGDNNLTKALGSPDYQTRDKVGKRCRCEDGGCGDGFWLSGISCTAVAAYLS